MLTGFTLLCISSQYMVHSRSNFFCFLLQISGFDKIIRKLRPFVILRNMYLIMVLSRKESKKVKTINPRASIIKRYKRKRKRQGRLSVHSRFQIFYRIRLLIISVIHIHLNLFLYYFVSLGS